MKERGWNECDVIIITGDAYVDHPSFGAALVGRVLESAGYRVGIIAQPHFQNNKAFAALGTPRLFWGITAGNVDSQLARLTVMRKLRRDDPYSPGGKAGARPPNATIVYASLARSISRNVPIILGGIEASLRTFAYYDYWTDKVRRSILFDAKGDLLICGMAERAVLDVAMRLSKGQNLDGIPGTAIIKKEPDSAVTKTILPSFEELATPDEKGRQRFAMAAGLIHEHSKNYAGMALFQKHGDRWLAVYPRQPPLTETELDTIYSLPFTRKPHPSYSPLNIPAYEMIRNSITSHRGCYADCSFCAICAHQGPSVVSRSSKNILAEIAAIASSHDFNGTISDIGGPTANMYKTSCRRKQGACIHRNCLFPQICTNLDVNHAPQLALLKAAEEIRGVKHVFISSGIRFDLALRGGGKYIPTLAAKHTGGLLKIAPEHICAEVLSAMRKPGFSDYRRFIDAFAGAVRKQGRKYSVVEYFMSGHPGCTLEHMVQLARYLHGRGIRPEQVQDFYPAPMTLAAAMYHTGIDPLTSRTVYVAKTDRDKMLQRALLLHHKPEFHAKAREALLAAGHPELIGYGPECLVPPGTRKARQRP